MRKDLDNTWESWQVSTLKLQWMEGRSGTEIANAIGKSRNAVMGKIHRLGLPKKGHGTFSRNFAPPPPRPLEAINGKVRGRVDRKIG